MIKDMIVEHENKRIKKKRRKLKKKISEYCNFHNITVTYHLDFQLSICITLRKSVITLYGEEPKEMVESAECYITREELVNNSISRIFRNFKSYVHFIGFEV